MKLIYLLFCLIGLSHCYTNAQTPEDVRKIVSTYNIEKIKEKEITFLKLQESKKLEALKMAKIYGWEEFLVGENGNLSELMEVTPDGHPIYYSTNNLNAAKSTRANHLHTGGSLGLNLNGQGMIARVWDGGTVRRTHEALINRTTTVDAPSAVDYNDHATHVTGTIISADLPQNFQNNTKGMAFQASARTFNWTNDQSEALSEIQQGMLLSNHSYGVPITNPTTGNKLPAWYIGSYTDNARLWDEITYLAPYYLPVVSAGNDGSNNGNANPIAAGYDKLVTNKVSKNLLIVANTQDANVATNGNLISVSINSSSSQGPTDDGRIKPDISGNGTNVRSCIATSNTATDNNTGTSMSAPNVTGTLLLLQQHHKNVTNSFMKAATLKGLACHTADDAGSTGPDPKFGWGLLNALKAVQTINSNGLSSLISENSLKQNQSLTFVVKSNGTSPLIASITWTDVPGIAVTSNTPANTSTPILVNDLDIRITRNGTTYFPWKLDLSTMTAKRDADNNLDNVELIKIDNPIAGDYTITISHKGNLVNNNQDYSLIVTGMDSNIGLTSLSEDKTLCENQNGVFEFKYKQVGTTTSNFSIVNLPTNAIGTLSNTSLNAEGMVTMTISNLQNVTDGEYQIGLKVDNGIETETRYKILKLYKNNFRDIVLTFPVQRQNTVAPTVTLKWVADTNAENYVLEIAKDSNFSQIVTRESLSTNAYLATDLSQETEYHWRVFPKNRCSQAQTANAYNFTTGKLNCGNRFTATDFSNASINTTATAMATVPVTVTGGLIIGDFNVNLNMTHTYLGDIDIILKGPASIGSPEIILFKEPCGEGKDINCSIDDSGVTINCLTTIPAVNGAVKPYKTLSDLNGLNADGVWTLIVNDPNENDGGRVASVSLDICSITERNLDTNSFEFVNLKIYPNPTKGILNIHFPEIVNNKTILTLQDIQGRTILTKLGVSENETLDLSNLQNGVYLVSITSMGKKMTQKIVLEQ